MSMTPGLPDLASQAPASAAGQPGSAGNEPKYVTIEEAQRMADTAAEKAYQRAQSLVDKSTTRVSNYVSERMAQIEQSARYTGQALSDDQKAQIRRDLAVEAMTAQETPPATSSPAQPAQAAPQGAPAPDAIQNAAIKMAEAVGGFEQNDPEMKMLNMSGSPEEFLVSVQEAVYAKRTRLAQQADRNPQAVMLGGGVSGGRPLDIPKNEREAWDRRSSNH